jgi:BirA family biotin operon repressor/biotin-[acetyl-CoA-carboxylase] ligase
MGIIVVKTTQEALLLKYLEPLTLGGWRYYTKVTSTNDHALDWLKAGAADWSLVVADTQTNGRGRDGRLWVSKPGVSLAISLILRPSISETICITRFTALGALGVIDALGKLGLKAEIKWPNDVLLDGKKVGGILVENEWAGERLEGLVVGLGLNVHPEAVPDQATLRYPAVSVEEVLGKPVDRWALLVDILKAIKAQRKDVCSQGFVANWNAHLAFREKWVNFQAVDGSVQRVKIGGVTGDGQIVLKNEDGERFSAVAGEIVIGKEGL